ncbi:multicopper oxidase family protein [Chitinimonas koreensis]|uniref:multicopper oxidase family protein n=1 Tax=Chitinimonas koreensis TaxID=356302 RepID=UPI0004034498|nr:multicopper oxidase domain-containing protein [Chitinimonas koreensis]QNM98542.1 multicopper oxidase domain-containing protein [Chitinimonas koreensis]
MTPTPAAPSGSAPRRVGRSAHLARLLALAGLCAVLSPEALAATAGCAYQRIDVDKYGHQDLVNPPSISSRNGALETVLATRYTDPATTRIAGCPVTLRTYNGQLVGPTLRVKPGDVMDIQLQNQLPLETPNQVAAQFQQEAQNAFLATQPASFNTTNLHTHGLHVSPTGNSDNVLLAIAPGSSFPYEIKLPANHTRGSYWYHAHTHGSTSIQVGSGMAGALIVEDDEAKIPAALREANKREKVMVFQTILYDTDGRLDDITALFPSPSKAAQCLQPANRKTWNCSLRRVTINGQIVPRIRMRPGEVQRWRMIDTAFRESFNIALEGHALHEIALDGIYLGRIDTWPADTTTGIELQPGYRSDVLVKASAKRGTYKLLDLGTPLGRAISNVAEPRNVLAEVIVEGDPIDMKLPTQAEMAPLAPFPGVDLTTSADQVQQVAFKLGQDVQGQKNYFQVNYQAFSHTHVRQVQLNDTDLWSVSTVGDPPGVPNGIPPAPHVFHIHVNPFQVQQARPDGKNALVWKDTVLIPAGNVVDLYTRYLDYIGKFVMHCHILDHEDLGMMEVVEVVDAANGVTTGHH